MNKKLTKKDRLFLNQELNRFKLTTETNSAKAGLELEKLMEEVKKKRGNDSDVLPEGEMEKSEDLYGISVP